MAEIERLNGGLYNTLGLGSSENQRTPNIFKTTGLAPAGSTTMTLWSPPAGKRFRLMGFQLTAPANAAGATNEIDINLNDSGGSTLATWRFFVPTSGITTNPGTILVASLNLPGNGYLGAAVTSPLTVVLTAVLTAGTLRAIAYGTEE